MATYYVDTAVGNDGNAGTSEGAGNAWATIGKAASTVAAADTVYIKGSGTYAENITLVTAGAAATPISWIGYTSTTGDGGVITIQPSSGTNVVTGTTENYQLFRNIKFDATSVTAKCYTDTGADGLCFINCEFTNASNEAVTVDDDTTFISCSFNNNSGVGVGAGRDATFIHCVSYANTSHAFDCESGTFIHCLAYGLGSGDSAFRIATSQEEANIYGCTIDGENAATSIGVDVANAAGTVSIINNIIYDCNTGISVTAGHIASCFNNLMNSNNTDNANHTDEDAQTGAPAFTDEANDDYTLGAGSPAIDNALQTRAT